MDEPERRITADGSATLYSPAFAQTFHSHHGAVTEARHVFLEGSGVGNRLRSGLPTRVLEVGLGTGLNFLISAEMAVQHRTELQYLALERTLLRVDHLAALGYERYAPRTSSKFLSFRGELGDHPKPGKYDLHTGHTDLELLLGDAEGMVIPAEHFHAVYHDGFSPDANPELWSEGFLRRLAHSLLPGGSLVSYTVKGEIRRRLAALGLEVSKVTGPVGGKREMLVARRRQPSLLVP